MPLVAAPFLLPAIIGAGATIGSSLINKSGRGSSSTLLPPGLDQTALKGLIDKQTGLADWLGTEGKSTLAEGKSTLTQPVNFLQALLGGDRTKLMETLAPEVAAINAQFKAPLKEAAITGRGSALQPDIEASRQSAISNLFFKERPLAADKLTAIAQGLMNLGTQQTGLSGSLLGDAAGETLSYNSLIRGLQSQHANDTANMLGSLGSSLGPLLAGILNPGKSGPNTPGPPPIAFPTGYPDPGEPAIPGLPALISSMSGAPEIKAGWLTPTGGKH